jgi:predicted Zn-dependent peptidase
VEKEKLAFAINNFNRGDMLYPSYGIIDVFMSPFPGNVKVKKEIRDVINNVIATGIPQEKIDKFVKAYESAYLLAEYEPAAVANRLGIAEYYYNDPLDVAKELEEYKKITSYDLKAVAIKYLSEQTLQFINIKPSF